MKTWIIRFSVNGIKNISNLTQVDFLNNSLVKGKTIDISKRNVKGIFGINGAGKTAYMLAIDIYNKITLNSDYLLQNTEKYKLDKLINKKKKELYLENIFAVVNDNNKIEEVLKHTITIKKTEDVLKSYEISERLDKLIGNSINSNYQNIYLVEKGVLILENQYNDFNDNNVFANILDFSSFSSYTFTKIIKNNELDIKKKNLSWYLYFTYMNSLSTKVFIDNEYNYEDIVNINMYDNYLLQIKKLKGFIQILKPSLKDIKIDKKINYDNYYCKKVFIYDDYEIDEEYESAGIKRIVKMYNYIHLAINGEKVFIDELDANISGVFLDKLIEFMEEYGKGQLCFSSHNILSMNILKRYKNSITTFGESGKVVNIIKNGHYSPVNLFYEGFIEDSPFNINVFDFFKTFDLEED